MRHKLVCLLLWFLGQAIFSQTNPDTITHHAIKKIVEGVRPVHSSSLKSLPTLLRQVPQDTLRRSSQHVDPGFRTKYLEDKDFDYNQGKGAHTFWESLKKSIDNLFRKMFGLAPNISPNYVETVVYLLSSIVVLAVLFFAVRIYMNRGRGWLFEKQNEVYDIDIHDVENMIQSADFASLVADAESHNDTRLSIRLYYLWLLKVLKDKGHIKWLPDKTNSEYLREIADPDMKARFAYLSYLYEYIWYGEFSMKDDEYLRAKAGFENFLGKGGSRG